MSLFQGRALLRRARAWASNSLHGMSLVACAAAFTTVGLPSPASGDALRDLAKANEEVSRNVQRVLRDAGYKSVEDNGILDRKTEWAIDAMKDRLGDAEATQKLIASGRTADDTVPIEFPCPAAEPAAPARAALPSAVRKTKVVFRLWGPSPVAYLSHLYERIAQCEPEALKPKLQDVQRHQVFDAALQLGSLVPDWEPGSDDRRPRRLKHRYGPFDKAVLALTKQEKFKPKGAKGFVLPTVQPMKTPELEYLPLTFGDLGSPAARPSAEVLARKCREIGLSDYCVGKDGVRQGLLPNAAGEKIPVRYYAFVAHFALKIEIDLPADRANALAEDAVSHVVQKYPEMQQASGKWVPYYFIGENVAPLTSQTRGPAQACTLNSAETEAYARKLAEVAGLPSDEQTNQTDVAVVEPAVESTWKDGVIDLAQMAHPFFTKGQNQTLKLFTTPPDPANYVAHALHVAHTIGAHGTYKGWSGLAPTSQIRIVHWPNFVEQIGGDINLRLGNCVVRPNGSLDLASCQRRVQENKLQYQVYNLSMTDMSKGGAKSQGYLSRLLAQLTTVRSMTEGAVKAMFVVATPDEFHIGSGLLEAKRYGASVKTCEEEELVCHGTYGDSVAVMPLDRTFKRLLPGSVLMAADKEGRWGMPMLAAPGYGIVSADEEGRKAAKGLRARCGSSHATPIVSATAARLFSQNEGNISGFQVKQRLVASVTLLDDYPPSFVYGVMHARRALESSPIELTIWTEDSTEPKRIAQNKWRWFGKDKFSSWPLGRQVPLRLQYPRKCVVGFIRSNRELAPRFHVVSTRPPQGHPKSAVHNVWISDEPIDLSAASGEPAYCATSPRDADANNLPACLEENTRQGWQVVDLKKATHIIGPSVGAACE
jgi:hypothetical protein